MCTDHPVFAGPAKNGGWRLGIWVQPGARKTEVAGLHGDFLKIRVQARAVDNKANSALTVFVSKILGIKASQVVIESGHASRQKNLLLDVEEEPDWKVFSEKALGKP
ncbi:DUF167 domain-containing protein [Desulfomicrobium baculatum]|uniref:UPF0235 protein Dbac_0406 n=1 Tax=Desulfomicrobium baculatum (strain DSM 4028 / VKM B-1378 / X) TaxID=525897 RepID=C7LVQ3_DESBD|nr:DUF167 domain-containing protein [Desulfomicrobium baculatum]ACU88532.1 protein of unknown function DUF167 [Desulfomicrobium baculatum DSM 4028]